MKGKWCGKKNYYQLKILFALICLLLGFSIAAPALWIKYLSHWIVIPLIALTLTLLIGLVLMDEIFELDDSVIITPRILQLKIEIKKCLLWALVIVCVGSIAMELTQCFFSPGNTGWLDPLTAFAGSMVGIILHIIGSKWLMKRVEFELERWEDNVL